uniref:Secreted RxLR effector peptide protein n=1 Tax=Caenorhabditis tropicalis TaxID=1561998 RepID=A0A1I7U8A8_9PELO
MSAVHIARLFILIAIMYTTLVASYSVLPSGDQPSSGIRFWRPAFERSDYSDDLPAPEFDDGRIKRGLDDIEQQLSKRTNLKRLVILSARGFGKK